jgi:arabinose-5-phosphate isomerase
MSHTWRFGRVTDFLRIEAEAITQTAARLDPSEVERAVELLERCAGKVVVTGIGKSGIVAEKIAATMSSTGTAAVYLHASDALHGGLGLVAAEDVVIALSNSGETFELIEVLPFLKQRSAGYRHRRKLAINAGAPRGCASRCVRRSGSVPA